MVDATAGFRDRIHGNVEQGDFFEPPFPATVDIILQYLRCISHPRNFDDNILNFRDAFLGSFKDFHKTDFPMCSHLPKLKS